MYSQQIGPENILEVQTKLRLPAPVSTVSKSTATSKTTSVDDDDSIHSGLLADLPASAIAQKPEGKLTGQEEELEDIVKPRPAELSLRPQPAKKKHEPVKIVLPSLAEDSDESDSEEKQAKRRKNMAHKSGLLSSLPAPEHVTRLTSLVPQSLSKAAAAMKSKQSAKPAVKSAMPSKHATVTAASVASRPSRPFVTATVTSGGATEESDDEGTHTANFFSLDTDSEKIPTYESSGAADVRWSATTLPVEPAVAFAPSRVVEHCTASAGTVWNATSYTAPVDDYPPVSSSTMANSVQGPETSDTTQDFDRKFPDSEFQKAFGKRGLKGEVKVINVNLDEVLSGVDVTKNLPNDDEPMMSHSKKRNKDLPSSQQKRKHQISYLAFKAKERDLELKNQWAENKFNKRQAQSKYGF